MPIKQSDTANRGQVKRTPKVFFWRYWLIWVLLIVLVIVAITVTNSITD